MQRVLRGGRCRRRALTLALSAALAIGLMGISAGSASAATCTSAAAISQTRYTIVPVNPLGTHTETDMTGKVNQDDTVTASFTINAACTSGAKVSLVSYFAPGATWDPNTASRQKIFQSQTDIFSPGPHSNALSVMVPAGCFQIDLVSGDVITAFIPPNVTYSAQGRLVDADNGDPGCAPLV